MSETLPRTEARAAGVVTEHTSRWSHGHPSLLFFTSVRFQTGDGRTVEFQSKVGTNAPPRVGDQVKVIYDPARPEETKVALGSMFKIDPKALLVVGVLPRGGGYCHTAPPTRRTGSGRYLGRFSL
jgi:hypothetical protein